MNLLVATEFPIDAPGGGPSVIRQMLKGFAGTVHWWSVRPALSSTSTRSVDDVSIGQQSCCPPGKLMPAKRMTRLKARLMQSIWAPIAAANLKAAIQRIQPDRIWVIPHDWSILPLHTTLLRGRVGIPWHTTIQDYPDIHHHSHTWGRTITEKMARHQEALYAKAVTRDATSYPMLEDLRRRTGREGHQMLHQGLEQADFDAIKTAHANRANSEVIKVAYAGTILVQREFATFVEMVRTLRRCLQIEIHLWGAHSYEDTSWFDSSFIFEHGNLPEPDLIDALRQCDWGFIPMALHDRDARYNRFSFPTKFITYLAAGLPVIAMGHPESSVIKLAAQYRLGILLTSTNQDCDRLRFALKDYEGRELARQEGIRCARENFDAVRMRNNLCLCLTGI